MRLIKAKKIYLSGLVVMSMALAACFGCAAQQTQTPNTGADAKQEPVEQEAPAVEKKTLAEWVAAYPLQGSTYMESQMAHTYDAFAGACRAAFGGDDAAAGCASCHAREDFAEAYAEHGEKILAANASDYPMQWSNCTNCHVGDPGEGVVEGGNPYGEATSASAPSLFPERDYVCGQCHAMFPGQAFTEDAYRGIDQYKYGFDPDGMLKAMQEYFTEKPITGTDICAGMVGVPHYDEAIDTTLYLDDACTSVEMYQNSTHQKMGLSCIDCHMPQTLSEDGSVFTMHNMTASPLENSDALKKCLTCHNAQGITDADAMAAFVRDKQTQMMQNQEETYARLQEFYDALSAAVAAGESGDNLAKAQDAYLKAYVYYNFQRGTDTNPDEGIGQGKMVAMNNAYVYELLEAANAKIEEGMSLLA